MAEGWASRRARAQGLALIFILAGGGGTLPPGAPPPPSAQVQPPLPRAKREDIIDALLYFRFKDRITGHKRQKAEVPSDPESVDDEALPNNLSDVSHSGSDSDSSSSSGSSSSSTTDGGSSSDESNSD